MPIKTWNPATGEFDPPPLTQAEKDANLAATNAFLADQKAKRVIYGSEYDAAQPGPGQIVVGGARVPVGADGQVLVADSTQAAGVGYGEPRSSYRASLRRFHAALMSSGTSPVDILLVGDSITNGKAATTYEASYGYVMRDYLKARWQPAGVAGGRGYLAVMSSTNPYPPTEWTWTGTPASNLNNFARQRVNLAAGQTASTTQTCTQFRLIYTKSTCSFTVAIDGGAATTVNVSGSGDTGLWDSGDLGAAASHSIVITGVSGTLTFEGGFFINQDAASGIRVWDTGMNGAKASDFTNAGNWSQLVNVAPDLVTIFLGVNDWVTGVAPDTFAANLTAVITAIRTAASATNPPIVLIAPQGLGGTFTYDQQDYRERIYQIAAADGQTSVFDIFRRFGAYAADSFQFDTLHPSQAFHRAIGTALGAFLDVQ